jgi:hypothetical protein
MNTSTETIHSLIAVQVQITENTLSVSLSDGRVVSVPISWYPRLSHALPQHLKVWELIGRGYGIHWPKVDEDISIENILLGQPSAESAQSFAKWKEWYKQKTDKEQ